MMGSYTMDEQTYTELSELSNKEGRLDVDKAARCSIACAGIATWIKEKIYEFENNNPTKCLSYSYVEPKNETIQNTDSLRRSTVPSHRVSSPESRNKNTGILNRKDL